jgi:mono/diheme cytochrome c family protein
MAPTDGNETPGFSRAWLGLVAVALVLGGALAGAWYRAAYAGATPARVAAAGDSNPQFELYCIACHGPDARGIEGAGVDLIASKFVAGKTEDGLVAFLKTGRLPDDPASRTGRPMPGFAWVPEGELKSVAAFVKARNQGH